MKIPALLASFHAKISQDKRLLIPVIAFFLIFVSIIGYFSYQEIAKRLSIPSVSGANFSLEYRKIPFDTKSIDITFSSDIDSASVTSKSVTLSPFLEGKPQLKDRNTISYVLDKKMSIGETYTLTIGSDISSLYGKKIGTEQVFVIEAIAGAQATKILPSGKLENLGQSIVVLFNIPLVALTNLDERDKLPCPLEITPKVEGKCQWTNGNILEFIPKKPLELSTKYHIRVISTDGLLYPLTNTLETDITTPELSLRTEMESFNPAQGIAITTSAPVEKDELLSKLQLFDESKVKIEAQIVPFEEVNPTSSSETRFFIRPKNGSFLYATAYSISVARDLKPKYGNIPLASEYTATGRSTDFLSYSQVFRNVYSSSGVITDTREYSPDQGGTFLIPSEKIFFRYTFMTDVPLDKKLFTLGSSSGKDIDFSLSYVKQRKYDSMGKDIGEEDNKKMVDIIPTSSFNFSTTYTLALSKKANTFMPLDIVKSYTTAPKLYIVGNLFLNNTETCVYLTNKLGGTYEIYSPQYSLIKTVPASRTHDLTLDGQLDYQTNIKSYRCPQKPSLTSYIIGTRLDPEKKYSIVVPGALEDMYGNKLEKDVSFSVKTGKIDAKDIYLYSSFTRAIQIIPSNLPVVLNILSINSDTANTEVCEMDIDGYIDYLSRSGGRNYNPKCVSVIKKEIALKNRFWNITPNKIDLEKDVLGKTSTTPFLFVRSAVGTFNGGDNGYMKDGQEFAHLFVRSNLSLTLEDAKNKKILFATSFDGKKLPDNLTFDTYSYNSQGNLEKKSSPITWNPGKSYYELTDPENRIGLIVARNNEYFGVLNKNTDQTSNYDFKYISGQDSTTREYLYMYSDRPLYRAGDTVFFKGLLREFNFDGYKSSSSRTGKLKVVDSNGTILTEMDVTVDKNSNFHGQFILPKDMPLGHYRFDFYAGKDFTPIYNNGEFDVLAYKKPTFKVNVTTDRNDVSLGDTASLLAQSEYYFGGSLGSADYSYSVLSQSYFFDAKDYREYQFGRGSNYFDCVYWGSCSFDDNLVTSSTGRLDASGVAKITYKYPEAEDADNTIGEKIYTYNVEVADPDTGKTVSAVTSQILHTTDAYVGVKVPYWNLKKNGIPVDGVVLDYSAQGISGKTVRVELWKREWKEIKKQGVDGTFYNESSLEEKKESEKTLSSNGRGEWNDIFAPNGEGEYEIRAFYTGTNKQTFVSSSTLYVSGENNTYWNDGNNSVTDLVADRTMMKIGETASFTLKSPVSSGKMLVTVEKDDGILDAFVRDITSTTERIELPIKESYVPNFYVKVFLIGEDSATKLPVYKRALAVMKVVTDPKKLGVTVTTVKKQYLPGDKVGLTVSVVDASGKPVSGANGSISLVDESLLALAGNPMKNPFAFFYDMKRYLGIETYVSLMNLIEKLEVKDTSLGEKGGAGEGQKGGSSKKKRGVFKDTAFWQADFTTDANGKYTLTTEALPDNLTTWVIETLVSTTSGNRVGIAREKIMTAKTVMVNENLPRFLGSGDSVTFSPVVFNKTGKDQSFDVTLNASHMDIRNSKQTVFIKNGASYTVTFPVTIKSNIETRSDPLASKITIKAQAKDSGELDEVENTLPIVMTSTKETVATAGKTSNSADEKIALSSLIRKNGGSLTVTYASSLLPNLLSGMKYLSTFPYGCSEQRTSTIMPTVYMKKLYESVQVPFDLKTTMIKEYIDQHQGYQERSIDTVIRGYLVEIKNFQRLSGGFGYWMDSTYDDFPLTIRLVSALSDISSIGYTPDSMMMEKSIQYLKNEFYNGKQPYCQPSPSFDCSWSIATKLAAIEAVLDASPQDYEAYKMYKLLVFKDIDSFTRINKIRVEAKLMRINALSADEKSSLQKIALGQVQELVSNTLVYNPRGAFLGGSLEGSRLEATTRFLEVLSILGPTTMKEYAQIVDQMQRWIIGQKQKDGSFGSTADSSSVVRSLAHVMQTTSELRDINMISKISLDGKGLEEKTIDQKNKLDTFSKTLGLDTLADTSNLHFEKNGQGNLYYDIALSYQIPATQVQSRDEGFFLEQTYYDYDGYKAILKAKKEEWDKYISGSIAYKDLKYPKDVVTYLKPIDSFTIGKLVYVYNRLITGESRDQVAFEGFIPSGSELVNPELKTENPQNVEPSIFDHEEWQNDRYFGTTRLLDTGVYSFGYIVRPTHAGQYELAPSRVFEFYNPEVFGRTAGRQVKIK